jgi:hypothetical protein
MLNTNMLMLNMPSIQREHGSNVQFDIVSTIDQDTFLKKKTTSNINGFSIDKQGHITGTLNLISYLKVAPEDIQAGRQKKREVSEDDDDEDDEDENSEKEHMNWM